jgi:hypothetical protein
MPCVPLAFWNLQPGSKVRFLQIAAWSSTIRMLLVALTTEVFKPWRSCGSFIREFAKSDLILSITFWSCLCFDGSNDILLLIKEAHIYLYIYVCLHFFSPLTPPFKARFYLYLNCTTARDFQCELTMGLWHQSNIARAPVPGVYYFYILKPVKGQ